MKMYYVVFCVVLVILILISFFYTSESYRFYGIADAKEIVINSETSVEIKTIHVVQGQPIRVGDTLLELNRPELIRKINEISHVLDEYKMRKLVQTSSSRLEIRQLQAQQVSRVNQIKAQIKQLEAEYELNKKLMSELRSIKNRDLDADDNEISNPLKIKIDGLKRELELTASPSQIKIDGLYRGLSTSEDPLEVQVERLGKELQMLLQEKAELIILAQINGIIGSVGFKEGENVSPFDTIMTLHTESPSYVKGYIHENVYSRVLVGQRVEIQSLTEETKTTGEVVGVGSRIVEYPVRLRKHQDIVMWGREIIMRIPPDNKFLLGEKVTIKVAAKPSINLSESLFGTLGGHKTYADTGVSSSIEPSVISTAFSTKTNAEIEASGVLYLKDLRRYLLISDDTEKKLPILYLQDSSGRIERKIQIKGLDAINDMESITEDHLGRIYIAASQSVNKNGKLPQSRKKLIRVRRRGDKLDLDGQISLIDLLGAAAEKDRDSEWAEFIMMGIKDSTIDIEGIYYQGGAIFLGFKTPLLHDNAVIIKIDNIDNVFERGIIKAGELVLWRKLFIKDSLTGVTCGISDMMVSGQNLYILTSAEKSGKPLDCGGLWLYNFTTGIISQVQVFEGMRPEGITYNSHTDELLIVFDNGSRNPSRFLALKGILQ